ncbi:MAG TPA: PilZ domain-containing protein [Tepidisphaeraceae bacterium]|nr:PilZ domain-containing protein [Tepidisphaeraceae bacterium]
MLSPEQFHELIALIQTTHDDGPKPGVRRAQRLEHPCRITIVMGTGGGAAPGKLVQLKDISVRGMCFLHNQEIASGSAFVATLEPSGCESVSVPAVVVHCRKLDEKTFQIGAEFSHIEKPMAPLEIATTAEDWMQTRPATLAVAGPRPSKKSY